MKVSWDDDIPNIWKVITLMFQTTKQSFIFRALNTAMVDWIHWWCVWGKAKVGHTKGNSWKHMGR